TQTHDRLATINGAILGLAGPGRRTAAIVPCTVIQEGDLADQLLNRESHPQWQGERTRMIYEMPANDELWAEYAEILADSQRNDGDGAAATEFYRNHREEMDRGAIVAWSDRYHRRT